MLRDNQVAWDKQHIDEQNTTKNWNILFKVADVKMGNYFLLFLCYLDPDFVKYKSFVQILTNEVSKACNKNFVVTLTP